MNKSNVRLLIAYEMWYRCDKFGNILWLKNNIKAIIKRKSWYDAFNIRIWDTKYMIPIHRFVAYIKYWNDIFANGIVVRHLNWNIKDNTFNNILIGTQKDNAFDRNPSDRISHAIHAASFNKKYDYVVVAEYYLLNWFTNTVKKFWMSKSTLNNIVNKIKENKIGGMS